MPILEVVVDPRVALVTTALWLATDGEFYGRQGDEAYLQAVEAWFGPFREHEAVRTAGHLYQRGFAYDAPVAWALHHDAEGFRPVVEVDPELLARGSGARSLRRYERALADFAEEADLDGFLASQQAYHDAQIARVRAAVDPADVDALVAWYGKSAPKWTLVVAPLVGGHNYGPSVAEADGTHFFQVTNPSVSATRDAELPLALQELVWHEFGHSLSNPVVDANLPAFEASAALYEPIRERMSSQAYGQWSTAVYEHVDRAVVCRLIRQDRGDEAGAGCVIDEVARGFIYLPPLYEALARYEADRERYPTFDAFGPELAAVLAGIAQQGPETWYAAQPWQPWSLNGAYAATQDIAVAVVPTGIADPVVAAQVSAYVGSIAAQFFGGRVITDQEALALDPATHAFVIYGTPASNALLARWAADLDVAVDASGVTVLGQRYPGAVRYVAAYRNPAGDGPPWRVYTGSSDALVVGIHSIFHGPTAWIVADGEEPVATGFWPPRAF